MSTTIDTQKTGLDELVLKTASSTMREDQTEKNSMNAMMSLLGLKATQALDNVHSRKLAEHSKQSQNCNK
jgi:hypothetical protein